MVEAATVASAVGGAMANRRPVERRFYVGAAAFVILLNSAGFFPSFVDGARRIGDPTWLVTAHAALAAGWLLLFLTQAILVTSGRMTAHRRLGAASPLIAAAMIATGSLTVIEMARRGHDLSGDIGRMAAPPGAAAPAAEEFVAGMFPPLQAFCNFGFLTGAGLWFRRRPEVHKRLMLLGLGPLVITPLIHLGGYLVGRRPDLYSSMAVAIPIVANALLFAGAVHDKRSRGRIHPVSLWVPILLIVETFGLIVFVMPTAGWRRLAMWLAT